MSGTPCEKCNLPRYPNMKNPCCFYNRVITNNIKTATEHIFGEHKVNTNNMLVLMEESIKEVEDRLAEETSKLKENIREVELRLQFSNEELKKAQVEIENLKKTKSNQNSQFIKMFKILLLGMHSKRVRGVDVDEAFKKFISEEFPGENVSEDMYVKKAFGKVYQGFIKDDMTE